MSNAVALAIKVTSDARAAAAGIDSATGKVNRLGQAGKVAGRLLAAGLLVAAGAAIKFTNAAADDAQASAKLAATATKVAGATKAQNAATEQWITAQGKAKGVTDDELRPALEKMLTVTKNVAQARRQVSLAEDISARTGKSLESVTQALAKAQTGSVAGLAKYQVQTKDAEGKTRSLAAVQKDLAKAYRGAAADSADTAAGKAKILSVQMGELQEKIGARLIPVMLKLSAAGLKVVEWIDKNTTAALAILGVLGSLLAIIKIVSLATQAFTAIQTVLNVVMSANPVVLIVLALIALGVALVIAYKRSETFRNIVNAAFAGISKVVAGVVDFIRDHWKAMLIILGGPIGAAVVLIATHWDTIKAGGAAVIDWVRDHWDTIKSLVVTPFQAAKAAVSTAWDNITGIISTAKSTIETVMGGIKATIDAVVGAFQNIIDKVQAVIDKIQALKDAGGGLLSKVGLGRASAGSGGVASGALAGTGLPGRTPEVHIHVDRMFAGSDAAMARELKRLIDLDNRRLSGVPA